MASVCAYFRLMPFATVILTTFQIIWSNSIWIVLFLTPFVIMPFVVQFWFGAQMVIRSRYPDLTNFVSLWKAALRLRL